MASPIFLGYRQFAGAIANISLELYLAHLLSTMPLAQAAKQRQHSQMLEGLPVAP